MHSDLYPYQVEGARWLAARKAALLADDMGVGKTPTAIAALDLAGLQSAVVLCPGIARTNWQREFMRWQTIPRVVEVVRSSADMHTMRIALADVLIISYALLTQEKVRRRLKGLRYGALIADEAHALKEPKSVRSRATYGHRFDLKSGLASGAERVWLLTGTPNPNSPAELWTHIRALWPDDLAKVCGLRKDDFKEHFCVLDEMGRIVGARRVPQLLELLRPHVLRRRQADVQPDLPPLRWAQVAVSPDTLPPMPTEAIEAATVIEAAMASASGDDEALACLSAQSMHLATLRRWTGVAKAAAVAEMIREDQAGGMGSVVVFAIHVEVMETLRANLPGFRVLSGATKPNERQAMIDGFQAGAFPGLICQMSIAATALTLTRAADVVFAESSWVPADMQQAAKRCHRIGQVSSVLARVVSLAGSIDDTVSSVLVRKNSMLARIDLASNQLTGHKTGVPRHQENRPVVA